MDNRITLPLYIQRYIIDAILNHEKINNKLNTYSNKTLKSLSLVCKDYFKIIVGLNKAFNLVYSSYFIKEQIDERVVTNIIDGLSKEYSIYNLNNINELVVRLDSQIPFDFLKRILEIFEYSSTSTVTSTLTSTSSSTLITSSSTPITLTKIESITFRGLLKSFNENRKNMFEIVEYLVNLNSDIKINIVILDNNNDNWKEYIYIYQMTPQDRMYSLEKFSGCINSSKYLTNILLFDIDNENFYLVEDYLKSWCVDSIITDYKFGKTIMYGDFSVLFQKCKLRNYKINEVIDLPFLSECIKSNSNLRSLSVGIDYSVQMDGCQDHLCRLETEYQFNIKENNNHQHWIQFCNQLSSNTTLKSLTLKNGCNSFREPSFIKSPDETQLHKERIQCFASIFKFNNTITKLTLKNFDEALINQILVQLTNSANKSLYYLNFYSNWTKPFNKFLSGQSFKLLCTLIQSKSNLKRIKINQHSNINKNESLKSLCKNNNINLIFKY